jgi:hypothetical protein
MRRLLMFGVVAVSGFGLAAPVRAQAPVACEQVTGKEFDGAIVPNFYLEGNAIPVQKRNAAMLKCGGARLAIFALLDTSGYSADVQKKYLGMVLVEKKMSLGGAQLAVGAYGFGLEKPAAGEQPGKIFVYDVAGQKVGETAAPYDAKLAQPTPLQAVIAKGQPTKLYLGRYGLEIR